MGHHKMIILNKQPQPTMLKEQKNKQKDAEDKETKKIGFRLQLTKPIYLCFTC